MMFRLMVGEGTDEAGILKTLNDLWWESGDGLLVAVAPGGFVVEGNLVHHCGRMAVVVVVMVVKGDGLSASDGCCYCGDFMTREAGRGGLETSGLRYRQVRRDVIMTDQSTPE
jgi:hypothetical protein